ncbi:hypothetical protein D1Y84_04345 [Acidipila sp. EB88]|nr:hypothetical protein D1Y84_04345 [Acidipila sp. EB88]
MSGFASLVAPEALAASLERFLTDHPRACVVEEGVVLFDMSTSRWTLETSGGRCVLQLWNEERNLVRTVIGLQERRAALRLEVRRFGQTKPKVLRLVPDRDQRTPTARDATRRHYVSLLARVLGRAFPELRQGDTSSSADLENSFGPAYVRAQLQRAQTAWAVVAINAEETQTAVDGVLAVAVLWLDQCRQRAAGRYVMAGVRIVVPTGMCGTVRERIAWLHPGLAKWELYELDEQREELCRVEEAESGNLRAHLVPAFEPAAALARMQPAIDQVLALLAPAERGRVEVLPRSPIEISFRLHGLEFAKIRHGVSATSFSREDHISFGAGASETPLNPDTEPMLRALLERLFESRHPGGSVRDPLFRMQPERWLESVLRTDLSELDSSLRREPVYTQVPALASADRGMLDLLAVTRDGRLAVLELKASEDLHMPLQGLDYWMRVRALHQAGEIARAGYFAGVELSPEPPLLYFVVPALRVHSTVDTLLQQLSPEIEWRLLALDEKWRRKRAVIFRKTGGSGKAWSRVLAGSDPNSLPT